jgi:hypothetical protein
MMKALGRLSQNDYKMFCMPCTTLQKINWFGQFYSGFMNDSNLNTPLLSCQVQFTEAIGRHYFEETNNIERRTGI